MSGGAAQAGRRLVAVAQRPGARDSAPWILDRHGRKLRGQDDSRRTQALHEGLKRHAGVRTVTADASGEQLERVVAALHDASYVQALQAVDSEEPRLLPEWAPPGLPADSPVWRGVVETAFEGMRTAVSAARLLVEGERFAYALSRPPGHHAGPGWFGGYCYMNTAAAAAQALCEGGLAPVAVVDVDYHFPTGTSAVVAAMADVTLCSLHASTLQEVPWRECVARADERFIEFASPPSADEYLDALEQALAELGRSSEALVVSLGYDTIAGDPHGGWSFEPDVFAQIGALLAASGLPVCVVQEGGYATDRLAQCAEAFAGGLLDGGVQRPLSPAAAGGAR